MYFSPKTSADGLVFHYDTGNTVRSYLGEPTTNLVPYSEYQHIADNYTEALPGWDTYQGTMLIDVNNKVPGYTNRSIKLTCIQANVYKYHFSVPLTSGQTYTISFWAKAQTAGNYDNFMLADGPGGYLIVQPSSITTLTTEFTRVKHTFSMAARDTGTYNFATYLYGDGQIAWLSGFQVENTSHATQYLPSNGAATTRLATQGLKDLTAANTIDLSNVSFDANAQMTFDGTNDTVSIPSNSSNNIAGDITMELVLNRTAGYSAAVMHKEQQYTLYVYSSGAITYADSSIWSYSTFGAYGNLTAGTYHHLVATKTGGVVKIYLDGTVIINKSFGSAITQTNNTLYVGSYDGSSDYFGGEIPVAKVYNRALTADEVARNFNAIKSRFNIG